MGAIPTFKPTLPSHLSVGKMDSDGADARAAFEKAREAFEKKE